MGKSREKISLEQLSPKLDSIARCLDRIDSKKPIALDRLEKDFDLQDIISVNIERAVQQCVDAAVMIISRSEHPVPGEMAECFTVLERLGCISPEVADRMRKSVGFRNLMVHEYEKLNWAIVHAIATKHTGDIRDFCRQLIAYANSNGAP